MKNFGKRITGFLLALIMAFGSSVSVFAMELSEASGVFEEPAEESFEEAETFAVSEGESLEEIIREQVEAFAKSIDQADADGKAADKLATHGMFKDGKKLSAGKSHPLTATLINSELMKYVLTIVCFNSINAMQGMDFTKMSYIDGGCGYYDSNYYHNIFNRSSMDGGIENRDWRVAPKGKYTGKLNGYDSSLIWMAGHVDFYASVERTKITKNEETYKVTCKISDRFDFATSNNSGFAGLISGIGALLFEEFDWEAAVSFNIKVPYSCNHKTGNYHWMYDADNKTLISDDSKGYIENAVMRHSYEAGKGAYQTSPEISYYHELTETIRLYHDKPWILEYDIKTQRYFVFSPLENYAAKSNLSLLHAGKEDVFFWTTEFFEITENERKELGLSTTEQLLRSYSGIQLDSFLNLSPETIYTFTYENKINPNGNMVYLTICNTKTGDVLLDDVPLNSYYKFEEWSRKTTFANESGEFLSGKDLYINFIGNETYRLYADYFDLRIWENGKDSESASCFEAGKTTKPTCTEKGYTTYTCSLCGYSKKADYKAALGHTFGEWETVTKPTAENPGEEQRKCKNCEHSESRVVPALGYTLSDINLDGSVDVMDVYFARLVAAKLVEPTAKQIEMGDVDLDGKITAIDANIIRKYVIGIIKEIPVE